MENEEFDKLKNWNDAWKEWWQQDESKLEGETLTSGSARMIS